MKTLEQTFNECTCPKFRGFPRPEPACTFRRPEKLQEFIDNAKDEWHLYFAMDGAGPVVFVVDPNPNELGIDTGFMTW
jgi:hypothetical protein